jgi:hypothetical protein
MIESLMACVVAASDRSTSDAGLARITATCGTAV